MEQDVLKRISLARGSVEPEAGPTEEPEAVDVSEDEAPEDIIEDEAQAEPEIVDTDELEVTEDETVTESNDEEDLYVEYKGREINLKDVAEWEQGGLRQSDYTRKTQELSVSREKLEADRATFDDKHKALDNHIAALEAILAEETLNPDAIAEMREYEPEKYIEYQEKLTSRKDAMSKAKESRPASGIDVEAERSKLWAANPRWLKDGAQTKEYAADMTLLTSYAKEKGYSSEEMNGIQQSHHWQTLLDAAKYREMSKNNSAIEKKVRKAPVTTKPRAATKANLETKIEQAQKRLKQTGKAEDAVKLRLLKRQQTG